MEEDDRCVGARIADLREIYDISQEKMAEKLNIKLDKYKLYESGKKDIPANILKRISDELNIELGVLLTGEDSTMHIFYVNRKDKNYSILRKNQYKYETLGEKFRDKKCEIFLMTVYPLKKGEKLSISKHEGQEFNYVLEGSFILHIHNHEIVLNEGDSVYFNSEYAHGMEAIGDRTARFLAVVL